MARHNFIQKGLSWHLLTGEYPPQPGGVSDYTQQIAQALAESGEYVHVWAPGEAESVRTDGAITLHQIPGYGPAGLTAISRGLLRVSGRRRLLVEYVASSYGFRGMNVAFALWLASWSADEIWVHFHEVAYGFAWRQRPQRNLLAATEWWMAQLIAERADRIFISIPGWRRRLGRFGYRAEVLPIPTNVPVRVNPTQIDQVRAQLGPGPLIGHFGTYGSAVSDPLRLAVCHVLDVARDARLILLGRGGSEFALRLTLAFPGLASRIIAPGLLTAADLACYLAACDVLIQPYPDGISGRRTTAMAGLALGRAVVSTTGELTEQNWGSSGAVMLVEASEPTKLAQATLALLRDPEQRTALGARARAYYDQHFSIARTLQMLNRPGTGDTVDEWRSEL